MEYISPDSKNVVEGLFDSAQRVLKRNAPYPAVEVQRIADVASIAAFTGSAVIYKLTKNSTSVATYIKDADATSNFTASTASSISFSRLSSLRVNRSCLTTCKSLIPSFSAVLLS